MPTPRPIKLVSMLGSLRSDGFHSVVAKSLPELAPQDVIVEALGSVGDLPHYDADLQKEGFPPAVLEMARRIREADGVVVVTPEYNYSVPGALENALDWLSRTDPAPFARKPVAIVTASPGQIGGARAQYHLRQIMVFLDADVLNKPEVMIGDAGSKIDLPSRTLTDATTRTLIARQLAALASMAA